MFIQLPRVLFCEFNQNIPVCRYMLFRHLGWSCTKFKVWDIITKKKKNKLIHFSYVYLKEHIWKQTLSFITSFYVNRRNFDLVKIFDIRFLMDLHVLRCPEHDLTISGKCLSVVCLSVRVSVCMWQKFCGKCSWRTNRQNFMKFYISVILT